MAVASSLSSFGAANGALWSRRQTAGGWAPWEFLGGQLTSAPGATALGASTGPASRVDVFVRGIDLGLYQLTWNLDFGWGAWQSRGGRLTTSPEAVWRAPNWLDVLMRGLDGAIWQFTWNGSSWSFPVPDGLRPSWVGGACLSPEDLTRAVRNAARVATGSVVTETPTYGRLMPDSETAVFGGCPRGAVEQTAQTGEHVQCWPGWSRCAGSRRR